MGICGGRSGTRAIGCGANGEGAAPVSAAADRSAWDEMATRAERTNLRTVPFLKHGLMADNAVCDFRESLRVDPRMG